MFNPKYIITNKLLENIKRIVAITEQLNNKKFSKTVLMTYEKLAEAVSTYASTSIEGNPLPLTEVKRILKNEPKNGRETEIEIMNYNNALEKLNHLINEGGLALSLDLILSVHSMVMNDLLPISESGKLREIPVVVNNPKTGDVVYLPPNVEDVKTLLQDLISFINKNIGLIDPLILAGIFHKQIVVIYPFTDGNGRTTRLLTKVLLAQMGLNTFNLFSFENYYNKNVTSYFKIVREYGDYYDFADNVDFTSWLEYFTDGLIDELLRVQKSIEQNITGLSLKLKKHHLKLLKYIKSNGFITDNDYSKFTNRAKATRVIDFNHLIKLGLIERKEQGPATYYVPVR